MDAERAGRVVEALRARNVMAHVVEAGVYEFGVRVVLDVGMEALWDVDGAAGLDAEIVKEGVLVGFVPHVPGSESFTESQLVDAIATTRYSTEGLHPPQSTSPPPADTSPQAQSPPPGDRPTGTPASSRDPAAPVAWFQRRAHWTRRGRS
ncbi:hypothetical protein EES43_00215 [Streptomyces sp. ADI96-02]|uniref:hypothetical protein n=1 Tax=unclassified Streptomyces TaxID=2593676 RepID=UPI000F54E02A|nr:hypothetical protein [Streptomyces sp. ADI96-02]RPK69226.1 hypothetical protein EES43_00215 [Streptomyces sp. ADI96-02]